MAYAPLPTDADGCAHPATAPARSNFCKFFCVATAALLAGAGVTLLGTSQSGASSYRTSAPYWAEPNITTVATARVQGQVRATEYRARWLSEQGTNRTLNFCHFTDICIAGHELKQQRIQWTLRAVGNSSEDKEEVSNFEAIFKACFHTIYSRNDRFTIAPIPAYAEVVPGNTLGFFKDEHGNHPAAWMRVWAPITAMLHMAGDHLRALGLTVIDQVQLFEQTIDMNGWAAFIMNTALKMNLKSSKVPVWRDDSDLTPEHGHVCYENLFATRTLGKYFLDTAISQQFRETALESIGLPSERGELYKPSDLRVVFLRRDRPLWSESQLADIVRRTTTHVSFAQIDEHTPYQVQASIFAMADIVVSVHGSQLENQVFMRRGGGLVEIFPHKFYHDEQERLAGVTAVRHIEMKDTPLPPRSLITPEYLPIYDEAMAALAKYPTQEACQNQFTCRTPLRTLGAFVEPNVFEEVFNSLVEQLVQC